MSEDIPQEARYPITKLPQTGNPLLRKPAAFSKSMIGRAVVRTMEMNEGSSVPLCISYLRLCFTGLET